MGQSSLAKKKCHTSQRPASQVTLFDAILMGVRINSLGRQTMDASLPGLAERVPPAALLGYLNFSDGRPDPKFQRALNEAYAVLLDARQPEPWTILGGWLDDQAAALSAGGSSAFRDVTQARGVIALAFGP